MGQNKSLSHKPKPQKSNGKKEFRYIEYALQQRELEDLQAYGEEDLKGMFSVYEVAAEGYSCKVGPDRRGGGFRAHLIDENEGSDYENACLSGRGSTPHNAWVALMFRHQVIAQGDWSQLEGKAPPAPDYS